MQSHRQGGFTYLGLIILVTLLGLVAISTLQVGAILQRRQAEQELLLIGREYVDALNKFAEATPPGKPTLPTTMQDLLLDPRHQDTRRYLRKRYIDPMTGNDEWGIVLGNNGSGEGIIAFHSLSEARPIKIDNFDTPFAGFKGRKSYREWLFAVQYPALSGDETTTPVQDVNAPLHSPLPKSTNQK